MDKLGNYIDNCLFPEGVKENLIVVRLPTELKAPPSHI